MQYISRIYELIRLNKSTNITLHRIHSIGKKEQKIKQGKYTHEDEARTN